MSREGAGSSTASAPGDRRPGSLIVIVGPSGAGKDSLIAYARRRLAAEPALLFVRRVITRPASAGTEDHDSLMPAEFAIAERQGRFAVTWEAHGLRYGVPKTVLDHVNAGETAVLNGSRAALPAIRAAFPSVAAILVTARPEVRAERLAERRRESTEEIAQRLNREISPADAEFQIIENDGALEAAGERLVSLIRAVLREADMGVSAER